MSTEAETVITPSGKSHKTKKDKSAKKHDKKRKRDDPQATPSKKHRRESAVETIPAADATTAPIEASTQTETPFYIQTTSFYVPLAPISQTHPLEGICVEHLSPLLLTYYAPLRGVVLAYSNPRLSEDPDPSLTRSDPTTSDQPTKKTVLARAIDEYAATFIWVTADFLVLRPERGTWIEGYVNLQNESHLGLVCWNLFNASIERRRLPRDWKWVGAGAKQKKSKKKSTDGQETNGELGALDEAEGYWEDGHGNKVDGLVRFKVADIESSFSSDRERGFISIEGTMLDDDEEERILGNDTDQSAQESQRRGAPASMSGALSSRGATDGADEMEVDNTPTKHRVTY